MRPSSPLFFLTASFKLRPPSLSFPFPLRAISSVRATPPEDSETRVRLTERLRGICAAIRASIDTHVRSEEMGLWPLFVEHFTAEEQEQLVGTIIGKTGAEALNTMLGW